MVWVGSYHPVGLAFRNVAQSGSASALGAERRRFKSSRSDKKGGQIPQLVEGRVEAPDAMVRFHV